MDYNLYYNYDWTSSISSNAEIKIAKVVEGQTHFFLFFLYLPLKSQGNDERHSFYTMQIGKSFQNVLWITSHDNVTDIFYDVKMKMGKTAWVLCVW